MHMKPYLELVLVPLFALAPYSAFAQAAPAATETKSPFAIGAGFSGYNPDYGHGHLLGVTLWVDYSPGWVPPALHGIGMEAFGRDLNYGRSSTQPKNLREDVGGGGVFYSWPHFARVRPYGKFEIGFGNTDFEVVTSRRDHQTRTVTILGGGVELRALRNVWVRVDYEHQSWPDFFYTNGHPTGTLNPGGFTVGALYHFSGPHLH